MRYIAAMLTAILSLSCAANAGGIWGEPAETAPLQTTGSSNNPLVDQAGVAHPPAASSRKTNGLRSSGTVPGPSTAPASGPRTADAPKARTTGFRINGAYEIGPLDVLDISVFQVPELTKTVQVADTGTVNLPLVGEIPVAGKTSQEVERDLTDRLGTKYIQNPQVTVYVKEYNSQSVTITGAVKSPGVYSIKGKASLLRVVAMAGGLSDISDSTVLVLRQSDGKRWATKVDISAIQDGKAEDPALQSGDKLLAGTSAIKQAFNTILKGLPIAGTAKGVANEAQ
jgi:polysaccharide biosynthesis/export protein